MATKTAPVWTSYKRYLITILLVVYTFNFIDRQIIAILSPAIKADLGLSDTQLGFLKGFAFALFYATLGIPIARLADKHNRVTIVSVALAIWSGMTALCGAAGNFAQLAAARIGVGVGEAGCTPPIHSLIADYFAKEQRATAIAIYSLGLPLGTVFSFLAGGWIAAEFGWRWAFVFVGLPGVALALLVKATIREPVRGAADGRQNETPAESPPIPDAVKQLWRIRSYRSLSYAAALATFCGFGLSMWIVDFLFRTHELHYQDMTLQLALIIGVGGAIGTFAGGAIVDRLGGTDARIYMTCPAYATLLAIPFFVLAVWAGSSTLVFMAFFPVYFLTGMLTAPFFTLVQNLSPLRLRAFSAAFFMFLLNAFGFGLGPLVVGAVSDALTPDLGAARALQWGMCIFVPVWAVSAVILLRARSHLPKDLADAANE